MDNSSVENKAPSESESKAQKVESHPSTSSTPSKTSRLSRSALRLPHFLSKLSKKKKKNRKQISKLGPPFTSTPDPSDGEGSIDYQESAYSSQIDLTRGIEIPSLLEKDFVSSDILQSDSAETTEAVKVDEAVGSNEPLKISQHRHRRKPKSLLVEGAESTSQSSSKSNVIGLVAAPRCETENSSKKHSSTLQPVTNPAQKSRFRLFRIIFSVALVLGALASFYSWSYIVGKVQYVEFQRTSQITSVICTLLSRADFLWKTDYYRKLDCAQDEAPPLPNQYFVEASWITDEIERSLFYVYGIGVEKFNEFFGFLWHNTGMKSGTVKRVKKLMEGQVSKKVA